VNDASPRPPASVPRATRVLDVGGSHVTAAVVVVVESDGTGARLARRVDRDIDPHAARSELLDSIALPARDVDPEARECVVAMPGPFDDVTAVGHFADVGKFSTLSGVPLRPEFARRLGIAESGIHFLNDAVAYGIGEWADGGRRRARRFVCITLGTGVGSAFLHDGTPVIAGGVVPEDGYAFRIAVHGGPLEDTVSTRAIVKAYRERTGRTTTVADIAAAARAGDPEAGAVLVHAMHALGLALAPWLARFETDELVIGGSISKSWDLLEAPLHAGLRAGGFVPATVRRSLLLADAPLLGAAAWYRSTPAG
jgi:glucokinase